MSIQAKPILKAVDDLKKEAVFICYEPNKLDAHGEWMSAETLLAACNEFNKHLADGVVVPNLFHTKTDGVADATETFKVVQSWITPTDCVIGETEVIEGTWLVKVKFEDDLLWDLFLEGEVSGVSIGARGKVGQ